MEEVIESVADEVMLSVMEEVIESVADEVMLSVIESVMEDSIESVVVDMESVSVMHSVNVPATQDGVTVSVIVTVANDVEVDVRVIETKRALPSAGESMPDSTKSSISLMYAWFFGG
jgi:hypothetical protein